MLSRIPASPALSKSRMKAARSSARDPTSYQGDDTAMRHSGGGRHEVVAIAGDKHLTSLASEPQNLIVSSGNRQHGSQELHLVA